jgi:DNA-binding NarL/FixJ family response regulator
MTQPVQRSIKVLCVDDDDLVAQIVKITLKQAGGFAWLGQVRDAAELTARAVIDPPDVVLMDLCMPGKCPFIAMRDLRAVCPQARVLMFSGHDGQRLIDRAIEAGASGYLSKDEEGSTLVSSIRRVAGGEFVISPRLLLQCAGS